MFYCHIVYDLVFLFGLTTVNDGGLFLFTTNYTGILFITLSGICATLGKHPVKRGLVVFGGGMLVSIATYLMYAVGFADKGLLIYFGVLHCIGICMLLWPIFRKLPWWVLIPVGLAVICAKDLVYGTHADTYLLLPFGIFPPYFATSDYFPLIPCLGYFLIGGGLGQLLYKNKKSLLPEPKFFPFNMLCFMGRHSLLIYLIHQPIITGCILIISLF
jgi:uncharacterized membrane protein